MLRHRSTSRCPSPPTSGSRRPGTPWPVRGPMLRALFEQCEARFHASQRLYPYNAPWLIAEIEETERLMGPDYHAHGLEKKRQAMSVFCQSAFDDGLTGRRLTVDEVFAE